MNQTLSNLTTKHYCPKCESFNLKRIHRGFIKKKLLRLPAQYECNACSALFTETRLDKNDTKAMPQLIS